MNATAVWIAVGYLLIFACVAMMTVGFVALLNRGRDNPLDLDPVRLLQVVASFTVVVLAALLGAIRVAP